MLETSDYTRAATAEDVKGMVQLWDKAVEAFGYFTGLNVTQRQKEGFIHEIQLDDKGA